MHSFVRAVRLTATVSLLSLVVTPAFAQSRRGRKYKAPPETAHIEVLVTKQLNGKPIQNAAVIFHPVKDGKDEGNLEVKTDPEGKAVVDIIPVGSMVRVQVIAGGYATYADDFELTENSKQIAVGMLRPQEQISAYEDNHGKSSTRKAGVQEPEKPDAPTQPVTPSKPTPPTPQSGAPTPPPSVAPAPQP